MIKQKCILLNNLIKLGVITSPSKYIKYIYYSPNEWGDLTLNVKITKHLEYSLYKSTMKNVHRHISIINRILNIYHVVEVKHMSIPNYIKKYIWKKNAI